MAYQLLFDVAWRETAAKIFRERKDNVTYARATDVHHSYRLDAASITDLVHGYMASDFSIKAKRNHAISEITQVSI